MRVDVVPLEWVNNVWSKVEPFFIEAAKHGDDYSVEQLKVFATRGDWLLLVAVEEENKICGAMLLNFFNRPNARIAFVMAVGGKLISTKETFEQFKAIVASRGATEIEGAARESVARLWRQNFGFVEKHRIVGVKL
jgi:hypothetical protein